MKIFTAVFFLLIKITVYAQGNWFWQNPLPLNTLLKDIEWVTAETAYGVGRSTIIKTTDGGINWTEQDCGFSPFNVHFIDLTGISFIDENWGMIAGRVYDSYYGFHYSQIYKTTNGGSNWDMIFSGDNFSSIITIDENHAFVFGGDDYSGDYLQTTDGGNSWISGRVSLIGILTSLSFSDPINGSAATSNGIYRTSDGGSTWLKQNDTYLTCIQSIDSSNIVAAGSNGIILRSTDAGNSWIQQPSGTTSPLKDILFTDINNGTIAGGYDSGIILRTTDGGFSWTQQQTGTDVPLLKVSFSDSSNGAVTGYTFPGQAFKRAILKTTNGGAKWYSLYSAVTEDNLNDIYFGDENRGIAGGGNGTIIKTTDGGETWVNKTSGTSRNLNALFFHDLNTGIAAGDSGVILKTTDGGESWSSRNSGTIKDISSVYFVNDNIGFAAGRKGIILKTTDGGDNWQTKLSIIGYFHDIFFTDENNGVAAGNMNYAPVILGTTNGGETWVTRYTEPPNNDRFSAFNSICFSDNYNGIAVGGYVDYRWGPPEPEHYFIFKTTDGGLSWNLKEGENLKFILNDASFYNNMNGIAVGTNGAIITTTNGGENWNLQYSKSGLKLNTVAIINPETSIAAGAGGAILKSTNTGLPVELASFSAAAVEDKILLSWQTSSETNNRGFEIHRKSPEEDYRTLGFVQGNGTTAEVNNYNYSDNNIPPGTYTYRLKQIDYDQSFRYSDEVEVVFNTNPKQFSLEQCYPNPFNPATNINFSIPGSGYVELRIYNILGMEIGELVNEYLEAGTYQVQWNAKRHASGTYFYRLSAGEYTETRKMILMR
jgi:photosystem II stability/assembly factor-like uncharacterized protein